MILQIRTKDGGWVYFDGIPRVKTRKIRYRHRLSEDAKCSGSEGIEKSEEYYPEFFEDGASEERELIWPSESYMVPVVRPEGCTREETIGLVAHIVEWDTKDGIKTVAFNGISYLLNNAAKTIRVFNH